MANQDLLNEKYGLENNYLGHYTEERVMPTVQSVEVKLIYAKDQKTKRRK